MIIWLTWRIAAWKWVVVDYLKDKGFEYFTVSQMVREEASKRWVEITRYNLQTIWNEIRKEFWIWEWMKRIVTRMDLNKNYIVDGIRNPWEIDELRKIKDFYLISIDADQKTRFERVLSRAKESDPKTWEKFLEIDDRDFWVGEPIDWQQVWNCMSLADFHIENNWNLQEYIKNIDKFFNSIKS